MNKNILGKRVIASLIDYFTILVIFIIISFFYLLLSNILKFKIENIEIIIFTLLWFMLLVLPEYQFGKTLGKKIIGIKIISTENEKPNLSQIIIRRIFDIVDILILGIVSLIILSNDKNKQRFGDKISKLLVVEKDYEK